MRSGPKDVYLQIRVHGTMQGGKMAKIIDRLLVMGQKACEQQNAQEGGVYDPTVDLAKEFVIYTAKVVDAPKPKKKGMFS